MFVVPLRFSGNESAGPQYVAESVVAAEIIEFVPGLDNERLAFLLP